jgi:catechol 2,3-dioxygenase
MKTISETQAESSSSIHPDTHIGAVHLYVADLDRQLRFYQEILAFQLHWQDGETAGLGVGGDNLLLLSRRPDFKRYRGVTGLYHFAILFPGRRELARAMARLVSVRYPNFPTDHIMTKTTYLDDPEGNGIELYAESPEDGSWSMASGEYVTRRADGTLSSGREPLDVQALFSHLTEEDRLDAPIPKDTRIGHVHLHIRNIDEAVDFYHGVLGFDVMGVAKSFRAAFVSAGGYHHHIGLNTWQGEGAPPPPPDALGLRYFTVVLPDQIALESVLARLDQAGIPSVQAFDGFLITDPSQNDVLVTTHIP